MQEVRTARHQAWDSILMQSKYVQHHSFLFREEKRGCFAYNGPEDSFDEDNRLS